MDWLGNFFQANTGSLITIILLIGIVLFAAKKGLFSVDLKGVKIGQDERTRRLIQSQFEYANAKIEGMISRLPSDLDIYHTKYILARVEDVIQRAIIFNNMVDDEYYIRSKQELVYQTIMKRITNDWFKTDEFKAMVYKFVDDLFKELVRMKRSY